MSQRNRIVFTAFVLAVALFLAAPPPTRAAGLRPGKIPAVDVWGQVWSWLTGLLPGGGAQKPAGLPEKSGAAVPPTGGPGSGSPVPLPATAQSDQGSIIDPNGAK